MDILLVLPPGKETKNSKKMGDDDSSHRKVVYMLFPARNHRLGELFINNKFFFFSSVFFLLKKILFGRLVDFAYPQRFACCGSSRGGIVAPRSPRRKAASDKQETKTSAVT
jgi:hypothetical protein